MFLLYDRVARGKLRSTALVIAALLACTITERMSFMIGMATFAGSGALPRLAGLEAQRSAAARDRRGRHFVRVPLYEAVPQSDYAEYQVYMFNFLYSLRLDKPFVAHLWKFLLINVGMFGVISLFEWRLALIAFGTMLPNILGTIGGAEKTGWSTHYHAVYFPFLVAAVLIGFASLYARAKSRPAQWGLLAVPLGHGRDAAICGSIRGTVAFRFVQSERVRVAAHVRRSGPGSRGVVSDQYPAFNREVAASVPPGAEVTTFEAMVPALYGDRWIHYYPIGLEASKYAVLRYDQSSDGKLRFAGAVSYLGPAEESKVNECLSERIRAAGYEVEKLYPYGGSGPTGVAVLKRER